MKNNLKHTLKGLRATLVRYKNLSAWAMMLLMLCGCSAVKHVPEGEYLLDNVKIEIIDNADGVKPRDLSNFLRQQPNHKVLGFAKIQLGTYNLSGHDDSKWYNRWLKRVGQAPVIYDPSLTEASKRQLRLALVNKGYLDAVVMVDTISRKPRRMNVDYIIAAGEPHTISSLAYNIPDDSLRKIIETDTANALIHTGMALDRNVLDSERARITRALRNAGYYDFNREYINYTADTIAGSKATAVTLNVHRPAESASARAATVDGLDPQNHHRYELRRVTFMVDADKPADTLSYNGIDFVYGSGGVLLRPKQLDEMCYLNPGDPYSAKAVERTYEALGRLSIVKYINIDMQPAGHDGDTGLLDAVIHLSRNKKQSASVEVEGTNSEGDLGFGVGLSYQHRNLAHGGELLSTKLRGSYESLSGDLSGLINNRYTEVAGEVGITFPKFECPFLTKSFKQKRLASTEFAFSANYQERPEYTRVIMSTAWRWKWSQQRERFLRRQTIDLIDISYVRLPRSTINFLDEIAPDNPLLKYSYEDHFIMRMGYTFSRTNRRQPSATTPSSAVQPVVTSLRASGESAGNLLYGISKLVNQPKKEGVYKILGIQYAQYVKADFDYNFTRNFNSRNALATHFGVGVAVPYGNSEMVPFEKRFYAGGANGVRGWGVRTLGPGAYNATNSVTNFINQCGDIRLDLSVEYRAKLFWVLEGALFVDAGNIWTIRDYPNQPGGVFRFNEFYKQIALAYGAGIRLDFTYFLLRFDLGIKAYNPAADQEHWPLIHPKWRRDANFHFAVGYPF